MAALVWDQIGDRLFETGVSKGVLYQENRVGVPWNGLTSIEEDSNKSVESVYYDGIKFSDIVTVGEFSGTMRAYTYPDEFLRYEGTIEDQTGFYIMDQPTSSFCLSYRTQVGDDISGLESGYKIHILYNLTAIPAQRSYKTLDLSAEPLEFEWNITSVPENIEKFRPTGHVVFDSRKLDPNLLIDLEAILYGDAENDAYLPSLKGLSTFIRKWDRFIITDNGDGSWTADARVDGIITMLDEYTFEITSDTAEFIDADSYTISSSDKNEEDIWLP